MLVITINRSRVLAAATTSAAAVLLATASVSDAAPTPVTCAGLETAVNGATSGEVLELSESCATNVDVTNDNPFTLKGIGSPVLTPNTSTESILKSNTAGVRFTLEGLTFKSGSAESVGDEYGGAVYVNSEHEAVTLRDDSFLDNRAKNAGGAVYIEDSGRAASEATTLEGDTFGAVGEGNSSAGYGGGGAFLYVSGPVSVSHNSFTENEAAHEFGGGGGLLVETSNDAGAAPVTVIDNDFNANRTLDSGAGAFILGSGVETVALEGNLFTANRVTGANADYAREGGGIAVAVVAGSNGKSFGTVQSHNTFAGNVVEANEESGRTLGAGGGGESVLGVDVHSTDDVFRENSVTVDEGEPPEGGALGVLGSSTEESSQLASFTAANDLFTHNSVAPGGWGGAIYTGFHGAGCETPGKCAGTALALEDSTLYANEVKPGSASEGGALWGSANDSLTVENSIIFANTPQPEIFGYATGEKAPSFKYSDVCQEAGGPAVPAGQGDICADPLLNPNGSETVSSPTIDAGSNALVPEGLTTDLAGDTRILPGHVTCAGPGPAIVDMGAVEAPTPAALPPCAPTTATSLLLAPSLSSLRETAKRWREGHKLAQISRKKKPPVGTTFSFTLNEQAVVTFSFTQRVVGRKVGRKCVTKSRENHKHKSCERTVTAATLSFTGHSGTDKVVFQGRVSRHKKLKPGRYTLVVTATNSAGARSSPKSLSFTIVK